eukprot:CAMPEP_0168339064 /NCGR_PEP_ID=MMETSP0213-20121227/13243_1 /TAXON_ID=151035 /ORGANISM="Euplotes harpa, Strain FSP1.4" /LENGTH=170 /DNA_ID=CAMNT_0008345033 /DNA_START=228 /DNA_END=740 /DNA_ORIENTATION=-
MEKHLAKIKELFPEEPVRKEDLPLEPLPDPVESNTNGNGHDHHEEDNIEAAAEESGPKLRITEEIVSEEEIPEFDSKKQKKMKTKKERKIKVFEEEVDEDERIYENKLLDNIEETNYMISQKLLKSETRDNDQIVHEGVLEAKRKREIKMSNKLKVIEGKDDDKNPFADF